MADSAPPALAMLPRPLPSNAQPGFTSSLESCSCVQIDGGAIYAVQHHDVAEQPGEVNMATVEYSDVLVWDFAQAARDRW